MTAFADTFKDAWKEVGVAGAIFAALALSFLPLVSWLGSNINRETQLLHSLLVLFFAGAILIYERRHQIRLSLRLNSLTLGLLAATFLLLAAASVLTSPLLTIMALCTAVASLLVFVFGEQQKRLVLAFSAAFGLYIVFVAVMPLVDWPLRRVAGEYSGWLLGLFGFQTQLGLTQTQGEACLILFANNRPFEVAAECNGFGIISASLLLTLLLVIYRRIPWFERLLLVFCGALAGIFFNTIRIFGIVLLAPHVGDHYMLMHEIIGTATFYLGLIFVWWLIAGSFKHQEENTQPQAAVPG